MSMRTMILGAVLSSVVATPVPAQSMQDPARASAPLPYDRGYDRDTARTRAINDSGRPEVQAANADAAAQAAAGAVDAQSQYARDVAAYRLALQERRHVIASDMARYDQKQRAYADAMADWRAQVAACDRGHNRACRLPTPDPDDYM